MSWQRTRRSPGLASRAWAGIRAAGRLQKQGAIEYQRGQITVLDRGQVERLCCECYAVVKRECDRLQPKPATTAALNVGLCLIGS